MTCKETNPEPVGLDGKGKETWRDLARRIEQETDPEKVLELARQLVAKLDEEGSRKDR